MIRQAKRIIPIQAGAPLLFASAALAAVVTRESDTPRFLRCVLDQYVAATDGLARRQFHLRLVGRQTVQLVDHLFDFSQIEQLARFARKAHGQLSIGNAAAFSALQTFQLALDYLDFEDAAGEVLLWQVRAAGDQAFGQVAVSDDLEQCVELGHAKALADVRFDQFGALALRQGVGTGKLNGFDQEAAGVRWRCWLGGGSSFAG